MSATDVAWARVLTGVPSRIIAAESTPRPFIDSTPSTRKPGADQITGAQDSGWCAVQGAEGLRDAEVQFGGQRMEWRRQQRELDESIQRDVEPAGREHPANGC